MTYSERLDLAKKEQANQPAPPSFAEDKWSAPAATLLGSSSRGMSQPSSPPQFQNPLPKQNEIHNYINQTTFPNTWSRDNLVNDIQGKFNVSKSEAAAALSTYERGVLGTRDESQFGKPLIEQKKAPTQSKLPTSKLLSMAFDLPAEQAKDYLERYKLSSRAGGDYGGIPDDVAQWLLNKDNWNQNELAFWTAQLESGAITLGKRVAPSIDPNWKPDYSKENPYEDMPDWYANKVKDKFKPTKERPLNPVEEAALKGQVSSKYLPEMVTVGINTERPEQIAKVYFDEIEKENPNFADTLKRQGIDAYYAQAKGEAKFQESFDVMESIKYLPPAEREIIRKAYAESGYPGYEKAIQEYQVKVDTEIKDFESKLQKSDPYLYEIYKEDGIDAYNKAVEKRQSDIQAINDRFEKSHTKLPDGNWMTNEYLDDLKVRQPYAYEVLTSKGYDAYEQQFKDAEATLKKDYTDKKGNIMLPLAIYGLPENKRKKLELLYDKKTIDEIKEKAGPVRDDMAKMYEFYKKEGPLSLNFIEGYKNQLREIKVAVRGFPIVSPLIEADIQKARDSLHEKLSNLPKPIAYPIEFITRTAGGALVMAPYYTGATALSLVGVTYAKDKAGYMKELGRGMFDYFKSIPAAVKKDPAMAGELVGTFILGPEGAAKLVKGSVAKLSPHYIPGQGLRYSFSTGKLPVKYGTLAEFIKEGKFTEADVSRAITLAENRLIKKPGMSASANIGKTEIKVIIEPTPVSSHLGAALWHSSTEKTPFTGETFTVKAEGAEPALFTSLHAAPRFALMSASGTPATTPALMMVYTKSGLKFYPATIGKSGSLATMKAAGFRYLGSGKAKGAFGPIKTYGGRFENEAMFGNGTKLYRVKNLRSRILGSGAGEFVTVEKGWVMPIFRFAEKGAKVPEASLATLAAIRIESVGQSLRFLLKSDKSKGRFGFKSEGGYARVDTMAKTLDAIARVALRSTRPESYRNAIDQEMRRRLEDTIRKYPRAEAYYRKNPEEYERAYLNYLNRNMADYYNIEPATRADFLEGERVPPPEGERVPPPGRDRVPPPEGERVPPPGRDRVPPPEGERVPPPGRDRVPPPEGERVPPPPTRLSKGSTDQQKRDYIAQFPGAYAINMGQLNDKRVWWTYIPGIKDPVVILGRPPKGARITAKGEGSGYKTAQVTVTGGQPIHETRQIGFQNLEFDSDHSQGGLDVDFELISRHKMPKLSPKFKRLPR